MRRSIVFAVPLLVACSAGNDKDNTQQPGLDASKGDTTIGFDAGGLDGSFDVNALDADDGGVVVPDPRTCDEAASSKTYVGCDFWPTVTDNIVDPIFDFAVVVANTGDVDADVTVTRNGASVATATAPANGLVTIELPWVEDLKSTTSIADGCPTNAKTTTVDAKGGAYHLTTTRPVAVYQFNALEYAAKGGAPGKDWASLCASHTCLGTLQCFSYTNDASLLLPTTALTGTYRIGGMDAWTDDSSGSSFTYPAYFVVTGTQDHTSVTAQLGSMAAISAGGGVPGATSGSVTFNLDAGEVMEVIGTTTADFSGTLIKASAPVQVITGMSCTQMPHGTVACDHIEESVLPAETLGKHYFVTVPTSPSGTKVGHVVRIYGNVDGTNLTYPGAKPPSAPSTINAGQFVDLGVVSDDFEIVGDHEFTVGSFMLSAGPPSGASRGDPSQSFAVTVEQYRTRYVFLAPSDYDVSFVDVVLPVGATLTLDGSTVGIAATPISSGFGIARVELGAGKNGAHVLEGSAPIGIQVLGYGSYTSYQYPGGLNLGHISPPPIK